MMTEHDLLKEVRSRFAMAADAEQQNRERAVDDLKFLEGGDGQWDEEVRRARRGRPCLTINRLPSYADQIIGSARQSRPQINVRPAGASAPDAVVMKNGQPIKLPMHDVVNGIVRSIEYSSDAESAYDNALEGAVQSGRGAFRVITEYAGDDTFEQNIRIRRIPNPFTVYLDPSFQEQDASDAQWVFVTETVPRAEFESEYPDAPVSSFGAGVADDDTAASGWVTQDSVRVAEYWKKVQKKKRIHQLSDGSVVEESQMKAARRLGLRSVKSREAKTTEVRWWKIGGDAILDGGEEGNLWPGSYIPICIVWGKELNIENRRVWKSVIRDAKDPARMLNYWTSAIAENIALAPKAPYLVTPHMVEGFEDQWATLNEVPRPYLFYTPDPTAPGGRPTREVLTMLDPALITERQQSIDDIKAATGIFDASLGAVSNEKSGRAIIARRQQGDNANFAFIDNLAKAVRYCGKIIVDLLPHVMDTTRTEIMRTPSGEEQDVELNWVVIDPETGGPTVINDLKKGKWEVTVTVGPAYATQRMESADSMMQFVQAMPQAAQFVGDLIAEGMDWPRADVIAERLKRTIPPQILGPQDTPPEMQAQQQQAQQPPPEMQIRLAQEQAKLAQEQLQAEQEKVKLQQMILDLQLKQAQLAALGAPMPMPSPSQGPPPGALPPGPMPPGPIPQDQPPAIGEPLPT